MANMEKFYQGSAENAEKKPLKISRRSFLKKTGGLALGAVAAGFGMDKSFDRKEDKKIIEELEPEKENGADKENSVEKENPAQEEPEKATNEEKSLGKIEKIAKEIEGVYAEIAKTGLWPKDLFDNDLFIAQQLQESKYKNDESDKNAVGTMQVRTTCILDVIRYANKLKRNGMIEFGGPKEISNEEAEELLYLAKHNADLSRAFGKIYMCQIADPDYGYGMGESQRKRGEKKEALKLILASYNAGKSRIEGKPESDWPKESRTYVKRIFNYMKRLENIRQSFGESGAIDSNNDSLTMRFARHMDKFSDKDRYNEMNRMINLVKAENSETEAEVRKILGI